MLPPAIQIHVLPHEDEAARQQRPFLEVERFRLVADYPNGTRSEPFGYDLVRRRALDAVIILAHHTIPASPATPDGTPEVRRLGRPTFDEVRVFLRSSVRPPIVLRDEPEASPTLWEVPAGLVEPHEAPRVAAVRELHEELGVLVDESALEELGPWTYPAPGFIGERQIFFHVRIDPTTRRTPPEDGSPLERDASIVDVPLGEALDLARAGKLPDAKTELALRRLADLLIRP